MANASIEETKVEPKDSGKCTLCKGDFKTPKLLPCQHSFCTPCLKIYIPEAETPDFLCPTCNMQVPLSSGGVESLPENYLSNILAAKDNSSNSKAECLHCQIQGKTIVADVQCLDCEDAFCTQCQAFHKLSSATKHHRLVPVQELEAGKYWQIQQERDHLYCKKHSEGTSQFLLRAYCKKCGSLHCDKCMLDGEVHILISKDKWKSLHKEKLETFVKELHAVLSNRKYKKDIIRVIQKVEGRIHDKKAALENQIYAKATEIQELVEKVKNEKLSLVSEHFEKELQNCKVLLEKEGNGLKRLESTVTFVEDFMKHSTQGEYFMYEEDVKTRMANYVKSETFGMNTQDIILKGKTTEQTEQSLGDAIGQSESKSIYTDISGYENVFDIVTVEEVKPKKHVDMTMNHFE